MSSAIVKVTQKTQNNKQIVFDTSIKPTISKYTKSPTEFSKPPATYSNRPNKNNRLVKLKISGSHHLHKFIKDLAIACRCKSEPQKINGEFCIFRRRVNK